MDRKLMWEAVGLILAFRIVTVAAGPECRSTRANGPKCAARVRISAASEPEDIVVQVEITNTGKSPYRLLKWNVPADGWMTKTLFVVHRDKVWLRRRGTVMDQEISADDYVTVEPGGSCRTTIRLSQSYDVAPKGKYEIQYDALNEPDEERVDRLLSNTVVVQRR